MTAQKKIKIHLIAAARPNFMKIGPLYHAFEKETWADPVIVHTGQHYDLNMSDVFFQDLKLPAPQIHLGIGSGSHAAQTGQVMIAYEKILEKERPDLVIVVGDVNSTLATTLAATKLCIKVAHLEAGLRSFDRSMPEEINRLVTDALADFLWTPSHDADQNLIREGIPRTKIRMVGNIMIDSLEMLRSKIESETFYKKFNTNNVGYGLVTLHRPANVDRYENLEKICRVLMRLSQKLPLVFPVHPRTLKSMKSNGILSRLKYSTNLHLAEPFSYIRFMNLVFHCSLVITDSGGLQEETTYLGIPCLTLRPNTERPITVKQGTNRLCGVEDIINHANESLKNNSTHRVPHLWDGHTAVRVVQSAKEFLHL
ncbi:MAG: UDP-N-acetylglucosamine 2-epimerase (non-hydrolyzing) [Desulfobacteraceae bacterium]|jgi:UDP-N-acetylglucosamine 2-epimerase (non-hydrolysing)